MRHGQDPLKKDVVGVLCADVHLSDRPPASRAVEHDWLTAQARILRQVRETAENLNVPVVVAGDLFHHHGAGKPHLNPARIVNFAIGEMPRCFAVPGNHDLRFHAYDEKENSSYWTLVEASIVTDLSPGDRVETEALCLHGFPCGFEPKPCKVPSSTFWLNVAVVHRFLWKGDILEGNTVPFPGAEDSKLSDSWARKHLDGYDAALFGDNHDRWKWSFDSWKVKMSLVNAGSLIRRKVSEPEPALWLLHGDGTMKRKMLDCSQDKIIDVPELQEEAGREIDLSEFLEEVAGLEGGGIDFVQTVKRRLEAKDVSKRVKRKVLEHLEERSA
jgi:UDP-2,3-diacylglucosamine pyrophosphatase LpxH